MNYTIKNENTEQAEWPSPAPLSSLEKLPELSADNLPPRFCEFAKAVAVATQTEISMVVAIILGALAAVIQRNFDISIAERHPESVSLCSVVIAEPSCRKGPVFRAVMDSLYSYESEKRKEQRAMFAAAKRERGEIERKLEELKKHPSEKNNNKVRELTAKLDEMSKLHDYRLLYSDITPEKLVQVMTENGGCATIADTEGEVFDQLLGQYSKSPNISVFMKGISGEALSVDRIGRPSLIVEKPRLSMVLTVQPNVIIHAFSNDVLRNRGFLARMLYVVSNIDWASQQPFSPPVPDEVESDYRESMRRILDCPYSGTVTVGEEAQTLYKSYFEEVRYKNMNEWQNMGGWGGKHLGMLIRIAAILHVAKIVSASDDNPVDIPIGADTFAAAINLSRALGAHAEKVYNDIGGSMELNHARYILGRIIQNGKGTITRSELTRMCRSQIKRARDQDPALSLLVEMGYLRIAHYEESNNRSSTMYFVNPAVFKETFVM